MLRREELIFRCKRAIDRADVEIPPVRSRREIRVFRNIRKGYQGFTFGKRRQCPLRYSKNTERCECQGSTKNFSSRRILHMGFSSSGSGFLSRNKGIRIHFQKRRIPYE